MSSNAIAHRQEQGQVDPFQTMANNLSIDVQTVEEIIVNTLMKAKGGNQRPSNEEVMVFLAIANEYRLNPLTKEIYAFNNRGAIQPIVSIDGWLRIINAHPQFDGMEFEDTIDENGNVSSMTCKIYRKDRSRHIEVTEYMNECKQSTEPWKKWPARMLRHKAAIQAGRYAFGLSGIIDEDEADRMRQNVIQITDAQVSTDASAPLPQYTDAQMTGTRKRLMLTVARGEMSAEEVINTIRSSYQLSEEQADEIRDWAHANPDDLEAAAAQTEGAQQ